MKKMLFVVLMASLALSGATFADTHKTKPKNPNPHKVHKKYVGELCLCFPPMHKQKESRCECYPYYEYSR